MRNRAIRVGLAALGLMLVTAQAGWAAGFALYEGSARGNALGGTLVGRADDPSAIFFNPAGITQLPGTELMGGVTFIMPSTEVKTLYPVPVTTETKDNVYMPPHLYATRQLNEQFWLGLGCYSRFGLGTEFPSDWPGRYNNYDAAINTLTVNPDVAWKLSKQLSVAAGVSAMWFDLKLNQKVPLMPGVDGAARLEGDAFEGFGYNFAARYQPLDWLAVGASYFSEAEQTLNGTATLSIPGMDLTTDASGDITLPQMVFLGAMLKPMDQLSVEVGAVWTGWSAYDQLKIKLADPAVFGTDTLASQKDWNDVWRYQFGVEYALTTEIALRAGYVFDEDPVPAGTVDYLVPADNRHLFNVGCGYHQKNWGVDLSYTYLMIEERDVSGLDQDGLPRADGVLPGKFEHGQAHMVGVTISAKL